MTNFTIEFLHPWHLLILIPALAAVLIPHFLIAKKFRRTRNKITSLVLHLVMLVLSVAVFAGMTFEYDEPNTENQVMILVDSSYSSREMQDLKDECVKQILDDSEEMFQIGVVKFGYGEVYAAPLSTDMTVVYNNYLNAADPDETATGIASALTFARDKITKPESAKIVLISDGIETDGNALAAIRMLAADGIQINTICLSEQERLRDGEIRNEVQLTDIILPDYNISLNTDVKLTLLAKSNFNDSAEIVVSDNSEEVMTLETVLVRGEAQIDFKYKFTVPGLHKLTFTVNADTDNVKENNVLCSYIYLETFDRILVLESVSDESKKFTELLKEDTEYNIDVINIADATNVPSTLDELRNYDQVILMNIANRDMPSGFDELLHTYVNETGGGLLTVGGNKVDAGGNVILDNYGNPVENAYDRNDMRGTLYQQMLPVDAINFTPPVGVMIIIDRSGSMGSSASSTSSQNKLDAAKDGAISVLGALSDRDWCGVMALDDDFNVEQSLIPATRYNDIVAAIRSIELGGGTKFATALERAGRALSAVEGLERRHIILVTDGQAGDPEDYPTIIQRNYENLDITCSIVGIGIERGGSVEASMIAAAENKGHGRYHSILDTDTLVEEMRNDISVPEIVGVNHEPFTPQIKDITPVVEGISQSDMPQLGGFYGTRAKNDVEIPLMGKYVPIYAQWRYGAGRVGSFMCDLSGSEWSAEFMESATGKQFLKNVVYNLFPTSSIRKQLIDAEFTQDNYTTNVSVYGELGDDERYEMTIRGPLRDDGNEETVRKITPTEGQAVNRMSFIITHPGVYLVSIMRVNSVGEITAQYDTYRTFSYSEEYDMFVETDAVEVMTGFARAGRGELITDIGALFANYKRYLHFVYDPSLLFIIIVLVLFLLDIAVRKFKFKWPHELIREHKEKKAQKDHSKQ